MFRRGHGVIVAVAGGGMIVEDQLLPSFAHLARTGAIDKVTVCARRAERLDELATLHSFTPRVGDYRKAFDGLPPRQLAVVALPDPLHFDAVMRALAADQHVLCVKPLALTVAESREIEALAKGRDLLVAVEYHKRFDTRSLMARRRFRAGEFGEFRLGTAILFEPWFYRESNFQNWFTKDSTDAFTYIGCHYVDLVAFITGLTPVSVNVHAIADRFPNGNEGWLWTDTRVVWSNGAALNVQNALGYPDHGPGPNTQGLTMWCDRSFLRHSDQYRGLEYATLDGRYREPSPDYMQTVEWTGGGLRPVGYGFASVEAVVQAVRDLNAGRSTLEEIDRAGLIATPANSRYNEAVIEAARASIAIGGTTVACATA
jgi:predicted dehydrogenase